MYILHKVLYMNVHSVEKSLSFAEIEVIALFSKPKNYFKIRIITNRQVGVPERTHIIQGCGSKGDEF